jgi:hypothetical protein
MDGNRLWSRRRLEKSWMSPECPLFFTMASAMIKTEGDPIAKITSFGFTLKGAFERVLSFLAEANPAG